jgi:hypothetical protein
MEDKVIPALPGFEVVTYFHHGLHDLNNLSRYVERHTVIGWRIVPDTDTPPHAITAATNGEFPGNIGFSWIGAEFSAMAIRCPAGTLYHQDKAATFPSMSDWFDAIRAEISKRGREGI